MDDLYDASIPDVSLYIEASTSINLSLEVSKEVTLYLEKDPEQIIIYSGGGGGTGTSYQYQITSGNISTKSLTLTSTPALSTDVKVDVAGGVVQVNSVDFLVSGTTLSWSGLGMETVISSGDYIIISF